MLGGLIVNTLNVDPSYTLPLHVVVLSYIALGSQPGPLSRNSFTMTSSTVFLLHTRSPFGVSFSQDHSSLSLYLLTRLYLSSYTSSFTPSGNTDPSQTFRHGLTTRHSVLSPLLKDLRRSTLSSYVDST